MDTIIDRYGSVDETAHDLYNNLLSAKTIKKDFTSNINEAINKISQLEKYKNTLKDPKINDLVQFLVNSNSTMVRIFLISTTQSKPPVTVLDTPQLSRGVV